ncbi:MAG: class I SAM-dependent methyltransferase [Actinomycetota bacterium]|nr:class I SAM-dependent methyltransferase [Actinomycetota bacterium]
MNEPQPHLYTDLAPWFHLLTDPADYAPGAAHAIDVLTEAIGEAPRTILELGSGGGNNAFHMKARATLTLTDLSPEMLALSRTINPECEHIEGDMRTLRLEERAFDAVFCHDAVSYLTNEPDLRAAFETAVAHLRPGGAALFEPDHVRETYADATDHGGHDSATPGDLRSLRYLQWRWDPDPTDTWYLDEFAYLLRDTDGTLTSAIDRHTLGLFPRASWIGLLTDVGFVDVRSVGTGYDDGDVGAEGFLARVRS